MSVETECDLHSNKDCWPHSPRASKQKYVSTLKKKKRKTKEKTKIIYYFIAPRQCSCAIITNKRLKNVQCESKIRFCFLLVTYPFFAKGAVAVSHITEGICNVRSQNEPNKKMQISYFALYQLWLLVWIHKDLLGAAAIVAERTGLLRCHSRRVASSTTSDNSEESMEKKKNVCATHVEQFWFAVW